MGASIYSVRNPVMGMMSLHKMSLFVVASGVLHSLKSRNKEERTIIHEPTAAGTDNPSVASSCRKSPDLPTTTTSIKSVALVASSCIPEH